MSNEIGDVKSIKTTSMNLNSNPGTGANKPSPSAGTSDPNRTKPKREMNGSIPMPK
jgi:hypothetical protein